MHNDKTMANTPELVYTLMQQIAVKEARLD